MKALRTLIRFSKKSNVILAMLGTVMVLVVVSWMTFGNGIQMVHAQSATSETHSTAVTSDSANPQSAGWGLGLLAAALSTGLAAVGAGIAVAMVGSAAMGAVAERPEIMGRSIIFVGLAEGIAIYGLIISIMILGKI
jgi:F0F1-type ATP synthase membrane subunit c/vacuolar-type H+-ATPase subunit K